MSAAYFMKVDPRIKVVISTGESFQFEAVSWDTGVFPPPGRNMTPFLAEEFRQCIRRGVGGMTEITREQYDELLKKKETDPGGLERPSREEWNPKYKLRKVPSPGGGAPRVAVDMHNGAVALETPKHPTLGQTVPGSSTSVAPVTPQVPEIPRPTASKPHLPR